VATVNLVSYEEMKEKQLEDTMVTKIHGVPLHLEGSQLDFDSNGAFWPIAWCLCVQDSPDNPCPCKDPIIVWLPKDKILKSGKSRRKNHEGSEVYWFEMTNGADVMVEELHSLKVKDLADGSYGPEGNGTSVSFSKKSIRSRLLKAAFSLGFAIGTAIDEETGASDDIADWLHDTLGDAPGWLKDLF
jgi:hypothetical protein